MFFVTILNAIVNACLAIYHAVPTELWPLIVTSPLVSGFQLKLHKWFEVETAKYRQLITVVLAVVAALTPLLFGWVHGNEQHLAAVFGANFGVVFTSLTLAYRYIVKDTVQGVADFKAYKTDKNLNKDTQIITPTVDAPAQNPNEFLG